MNLAICPICRQDRGICKKSHILYNINVVANSDNIYEKREIT